MEIHFYVGLRMWLCSLLVPECLHGFCCIVVCWFHGGLFPVQSTPPGQPVLQALVTQQNLILTPVHQPSELDTAALVSPPGPTSGQTSL